MLVLTPVSTNLHERLQSLRRGCMYITSCSTAVRIVLCTAAPTGICFQGLFVCTSPAVPVGCHIPRDVHTGGVQMMDSGEACYRIKAAAAAASCDLIRSRCPRPRPARHVSLLDAAVRMLIEQRPKRHQNGGWSPKHLPAVNAAIFWSGLQVSRTGSAPLCEYIAHSTFALCQCIHGRRLERRCSSADVRRNTIFVNNSSMTALILQCRTLEKYTRRDIPARTSGRHVLWTTVRAGSGVRQGRTGSKFVWDRWMATASQM